MPKQKSNLSFTEARLEIEGAPSYEYHVYIHETGETRRVQCAGGESFCLIATNAKALSLLDVDEKQKWRIHQKRLAIERVYKAFSPELRYVHEHPVLESWKNERGKTGRSTLSLEMSCLRVAVHQLMNHGIKKGCAFELLARVLPELAPHHFENTGNLNTDADRLRRCYEKSDDLLSKADNREQKNLIEALKQIDTLHKELEKTQKRYARLTAQKLHPGEAEREIFKPLPPLPEKLDFAEIEAWSAKEAGPVGEESLLVGASEGTQSE